jgi:nucleoside-diphosphate-sugar epimerase
MPTIVTGGAGFVGSNLVSTSGRTYEIRVLDNLSTIHSRFLSLNPGKSELIEIDIGRNHGSYVENISCHCKSSCAWRLE